MDRLYHRLGQAGVRPGRDIAVIGFRANPQVRFLSPRVSCYRLSLADLGVSLGETSLALTPAFEGTYSVEPSRRIWPLAYSERLVGCFRRNTLGRCCCRPNGPRLKT